MNMYIVDSSDLFILEGIMKIYLLYLQENTPKYKPTLVRDDGVMQLLDPYVPTSHRTHKRFSRHELNGVPKKDAATYWRCEDYPQAWGHGTKHK